MTSLVTEGQQSKKPEIHAFPGENDACVCLQSSPKRGGNKSFWGQIWDSFFCCIGGPVEGVLRPGRRARSRSPALVDRPHGLPTLTVVDAVLTLADERAHAGRCLPGRRPGRTTTRFLAAPAGMIAGDGAVFVCGALLGFGLPLLLPSVVADCMFNLYRNFVQHARPIAGGLMLDSLIAMRTPNLDRLVSEIFVLSTWRVREPWLFSSFATRRGLACCPRSASSEAIRRAP